MALSIFPLCWRVALPLVIVVAALGSFFDPEQAASGSATILRVDRSDDPGASVGVCSPAPNDCSLRGAISTANGGIGQVIIRLQADTTYNLTRKALSPEDANATGDLDITRGVTIEGHADGGSAISGHSINERVLHIAADAITVTLRRLTIQDGTALGSDPSNDGGGIYQPYTNTTLTLANSTVMRNTVGNEGGGIYSSGNLQLTNSAVVGNNGSLSGFAAAGIYSNGGTVTVTNGEVSRNTNNMGIVAVNLTLTNSTVADNGHSGVRAGGIVVIDGTTISGNDRDGIDSISLNPSLTLRNVTISGNGQDGIAMAPTGGPNLNANNVTITRNGGLGIDNQFTLGTTTLANTIVAGNTQGSCDSPADSATNVIDGNGACGGMAVGAGLGPFDFHGGRPVKTHSLNPGSAALDAGSGCESDDQRGVPRPQHGPCDIGAVEAIFCFGLPDTRVGTDGGNVLGGTSGDDVFVGRAGNDTFNLGPGTDRACGGGGADRFNGGTNPPGAANRDRCEGSTGSDVHLGGCEVRVTIP